MNFQQKFIFKMDFSVKILCFFYNVVKLSSAINFGKIVPLLPDSTYSNLVYVSSLTESDYRIEYISDLFQTNDVSILVSVLFSR